MPAIRRSLRSTAALLALAAWTCSAPSLDTPAGAPTEPLFGKAAAAGLSVSSTQPSSVARSTTVDVHVIGKGFVAGGEAGWLLHGVGNWAEVRGNGGT